MGTVVEQANYFGEPFEDIGDWANFMADKVTPIAVQGIIEDPQPHVAGAEFAGLRVFPKSPWELLDEERESIAIREYGQPYDALNDLDRTKVDKADTIIQLRRDVDAQTVSRGDAVSIGFLNRQRERDSARQVYEETLNGLQQAYNDKVITAYDFRIKMGEAGYGLGVTYKHIDSQPEYKDVLEKLQEPRDLTDKHIEDIAYAEFMDKLYQSNEFEDQYGIFQFDRYNQFIEEFKTKYGDEVYQYILDKKEERDANFPPLAKEYQIAKEVLKPYWQVQDYYEGIFGKPRTKWELRRLDNIVGKVRKNLRRINPAIEKYYSMFYVKPTI